MVNVYFDNLSDKVIEELLTANTSVKICVAWINFDFYKDTLIKLLEKKIKVEIIINNDEINNKYEKIIEELKEKNVKIKKVTMPTNRRYMHNKFCIIDNIKCIWGSFNWTKNADENNFENLSESDEENVILQFEKEFKTISILSDENIKNLQDAEKCECCKEPIINLCVLSDEGKDYQTKVEIFRVCGCGLKYIEDEYFTIETYYDLISIYNRYDGGEELDERYYENKEEICNCEIQMFLMGVGQSIKKYPIIHAIGVYKYKIFSSDELIKYIKVLWRNKFIGDLVNDEYYLE